MTDEEIDKLNAETEELRWRNGCIDAYQPIEEVGASRFKGEFDKCPTCDRQPRLWIFDNGVYAKCLCGEIYGPPMACSESIMSVYTRGDDTSIAEYRSDDIRVAWNKYVETGEPQLDLPPNCW